MASHPRNTGKICSTDNGFPVNSVLSIYAFYGSMLNAYTHQMCLKVLTHGSRELRNMRRQIAKGFHSLRGKINKIFLQGRECGNVPEESPGARPDLKGQDVCGTGRQASVRMVARREFEKIVDEERTSDRRMGWLLIADVDRFREISGLYGQDTADAALRHVADVLAGTFAEAACMAGFGRDIFAMWLPDVSETQADRLFRQVCEINDLLLHPAAGFPPLTLSVGMAFDGASEDCISLGRKAVRALNCVKESGRCGCRVYDSQSDSVDENAIPGVQQNIYGEELSAGQTCSRQHSSRVF